MDKKQKEIYQDTDKLRQLLKQLNGKKFQLDCGYHVTFGHFLGNDITIYNGNRFRVICSQGGYLKGGCHAKTNQRIHKRSHHE